MQADDSKRAQEPSILANIFEGQDAPPNFPINDIPTAIGQALNTPYTVELGDVFFGNLTTSSFESYSDTDAVRISLHSGQEVVAEATGSGAQGFTHLRDPILFLYDDSGQLLATDDDSGPRADPRLSFTAPESGDYFFVIESYDDILGNPVGYEMSFFGSALEREPGLPSSGNDTITGTSGSDLINAFSGNDEITGLGGFDTIYGGDGIDTVVLQGERSEYWFALSEARNGNFTISHSSYPYSDDTDYLHSIERLSFRDGTLAFDVEENAGQIYRLYQAAFDREPDDGGLSFWINVFDEGNLSLGDIGANFIESAEFASLYGQPGNVSDSDFIGLLYNNVLDREPDAAGFAYWNNQADNGLSREAILSYFSESDENVANVSDQISSGIWYGLS